MNNRETFRLLNAMYGMEISDEEISERKNKVRFMALEMLGYKPEKIIHNENATIVLWNDGTKTVIKGQGDDLFAAFCICFAKKYCHGSTVLNRLFDYAEEKK